MKHWNILLALSMGALLTAACSDDDEYTPDPKDSEDVQVNKGTQNYLSSTYLWNGEYNTFTPNYEQNYEDFLTNSLMQLTTNTLDKKPNASGGYSLYSYIEVHNGVGSDTEARAADEKEREYSFGITGITAVNLSTSDSTASIYFCVQGVYPGSAADKAGIRRGSMIREIDHEEILQENYGAYYTALLQPSDAGITATLTVQQVDSGKLSDDVEVQIASEAAYCNPIIFQKVAETAGHKIGYLVYDGFDAGYDEELLSVFQGFRSQNVTDLVLDLRYNRGGLTTEANLLATCIAGKNSRDKVFSSMRFNDERMKKRKNRREDTKFCYPNSTQLGKDITDCCLDLTRVYVLTGTRTASASELVVNALRGIDTGVILIGDTTEGKNVGMEVKTIETTSGNKYRLVPITFQSYNAKGESDYQDGFAPSIYIKETNPNNQERAFYVHREYGTDAEPLYARAIAAITGSNAKPMKAPAARGQKGELLTTPSLKRFGHYGMIKR